MCKVNDEAAAKAAYEAAIPDCCELRTADEHAEQLMLCWGITKALADGKTVKDSEGCKSCEYCTQ